MTEVLSSSTSVAAPTPVTRTAYRYVFCAALNSCNLGYDIGVSTTAARLVQVDWNLSDVQRQMLVGSINFWAILGALMAQYVSDRYGRRKTFFVAAIGFLLGVVFMAFSPFYWTLLMGRMFVGLGVGVGLAIDPLYIAEISPTEHRGRLVTYAEIALNVGIVLGFSTGFFFGWMSIGVQWRFMFLLGGIMPCIMILLILTVMPESPRWLVAQDRVDEARIVLKDVYEAGYDIEPIIAQVRESIAVDQRAERALGWEIMFHPTPAFRRMLLVGVGMAVAQQAIGIDAIQYYLLDLIDVAGVTSDSKESVVLVMLGMIKLIFVIFSGTLFDKSGRRRLVFISLLGCAFSLLLISICFIIDSTLSSTTIILSLAVYLAFFSIGMGPGGWLIPSEVFSLSIRGKAMCVATVANRVTATLISSTFLSTAKVTGWAGFFFMMSIVCLIVFAFMYVFLPETNGKSLEDMSVYFAGITGDNSVLEAEAAIKNGGGSNNGVSLNPISNNEVI